MKSKKMIKKSIGFWYYSNDLYHNFVINLWRKTYMQVCGMKATFSFT